MLSPEAEVTRLLSNLYKPWFVHAENTSARVINSDAILAECLEKDAAKVSRAKQIESGGFAEGLVAGNADAVVLPEEDVDYVQKAKEESEKILADAQAQADELVRQAENESADIRETAKNQGYQEGQEQLNRELEQRRMELEEAHQKKSEQLENEYRSKMQNMEKDLVDVILEVFNKVFHIQFDHKEDILLYLINNAISNIEGEKKFRIKVAESNVLFLENHKDDISDRVGHDIALEILGDSTMDGNNCVIETDSGVFDCSLGVQLENLIKDIRSLCS